MVQRKHSVEFLLILRSVYRYSILHEIVKHITKEESDHLRNCVDRKYYKKLYSDMGFTNLTDDILISFYERLPSLINYLDQIVSYGRLTWNFPKGKPERGEQFINCAMREFEEELGFKLPSGAVPSNVMFKEYLETYEKNISIHNFYFLMTCEDEFELPKVEDENNEVLDSRWISIEESLGLVNTNNIKCINEVKDYINC